MILHLLEFQGADYDSDTLWEHHKMFTHLWTTADDLMIRALDLLGFDCIEDFTESVWADKPTKPLTPPTGVST